MSVYFAERDGLIKIGYSSRPRERAVKLGATLLATVPGGFADELNMHARFKADRVEGEWFRPSEALRAFIERIPKTEPPGQILTAGDVAEMFKVSVVTVGNWASAGKLRCFRTPGGHRRFRVEDVEAFIAETETEVAANKAAS